MAIGKIYEIVLDIDGNETVLHDLRISKFSHGDEESFVNESATKREDQLLSTLYIAKVSYSQDKVPGLETTLQALVDTAKEVSQRVFGDVFPKQVTPPIVVEEPQRVVDEEKVIAIAAVTDAINKVVKGKKGSV